MTDRVEDVVRQVLRPFEAVLEAWTLPEVQELIENAFSRTTAYGNERAKEMRGRAGSVAGGMCECYMGESCPFCDVALAIRALPLTPEVE